MGFRIREGHSEGLRAACLSGSWGGGGRLLRLEEGGKLVMFVVACSFGVGREFPLNGYGGRKVVRPLAVEVRLTKKKPPKFLRYVWPFVHA